MAQGSKRVWWLDRGGEGRGGKEGVVRISEGDYRWGREGGYRENVSRGL